MKSKATNDLPEIEWEDLQQELLESDPDERMAVYKTTGVDANGNEYTGSAYFFSDELDEIKDIELITPKKTEGRGKTAERELESYLERINNIMCSSFIIKDYPFSRFEGEKIMDVLNEWATKF